MAARKRKSQDEGGGVADWIVTFSDCMTLLLCFFVLLLTFSSFDEVELQRLAGAFHCQTDDSIFPTPRESRDSAVPPVERTFDTTEKGSEVPTSQPPEMVENPRKLSVVLEDEAYRDRKVFYIPSEWLFWGKGTALTGEGRQYLRDLASFMRMLPSRVVIAETGPAEGDPARQDVRLDRAWAVMRFLTDAMKLPAGRFNITASDTPVPTRLSGHRVVAVALISRSVY